MTEYIPDPYRIGVSHRRHVHYRQVHRWHCHHRQTNDAIPAVLKSKMDTSTQYMCQILFM